MVESALRTQRFGRRRPSRPLSAFEHRRKWRWRTQRERRFPV